MAGYDRESEMKAFDDAKSGVKGLVDAGIAAIPQFFHHPPDAADTDKTTLTSRPKIPVIDLGITSGDVSGREVVVELVRQASETFGFFQVVNHGIPLFLLDDMLEGVRRFNEQDLAVKMRYYTRDPGRKVLFNSNFDLFESPAANWRDTLFCVMAPEPAAKPEDLPDAAREIILEYTREVQRLGGILFELLSEALGLKTEYLNEIECGRGLDHVSHYYPPCPEPELTLGTTKHTDPDFITVLLQDHIGGLQVLHHNQWIDVPPVPGALVINIGDLLQLVSNDKLKSVEHRVRANKIGPRVSVACFFTTNYIPHERRYGPIKELLGQKNPPKYKEITNLVLCAIITERNLLVDASKIIEKSKNSRQKSISRRSQPQASAISDTMPRSASLAGKNSPRWYTDLSSMLTSDRSSRLLGLQKITEWSSSYSQQSSSARRVAFSRCACRRNGREELRREEMRREERNREEIRREERRRGRSVGGSVVGEDAARKRNLLSQNA